MKLSNLKEELKSMSELRFQVQNGSWVPPHFHITEVGLVTRHFIDCGGTVRKERHVNLQLWSAEDHDHRLQARKLLKIIELSERTLGLEDLEVEVEFQSNTIGRYRLGLEAGHFVLIPTLTACLASDKCGVAPAMEAEPAQAAAGSRCC